MTSTTDAVPTDQLTDWASGLQFTHLSPGAVEMLRDDIVDGIGIGLYGSSLPAPSLIRETVLHQATGSRGACTVWGTSAKAGPLDAALMNASSVSSFEMDNSCELVRGAHGSATVYPAILAIAELTRDVTGPDLMAAAAAGWETSVRLAMALGPSVFSRGWYGTSTFAPLGSAVAAGRALRLNPEQMRACLGLALLQAGGVAVAGDVELGKPLASGEAVRSGVRSALLAARGGRGPRHAYDHSKGFARAFGLADERNDDALVVDPRGSLACENIGFKAYASSGPGQIATELIALMMEDDPAIGADTVERIRVRISANNAKAVGAAYVPSDVKNAQFNLGYCVAVLLLEGDNSIEQFRQELLNDPRAIELSRKVEVVGDSQVGSGRLTRNEAYVEVDLKDGTTREAHSASKRKMDRPRIRRKFDGLARRRLDAPASERFLEVVDDLENVSDASALARALVPAVGVRPGLATGV